MKIRPEQGRIFYTDNYRYIASYVESRHIKLYY